MPCVFGLLISLAFAWACGLPKPQCLSVTIETCYQNTAIPLAVILSSFSNDDADLCASVGMTPRRVWAERAGAGASTSDLLPACDVLGMATGIPTFYQVIQISPLACVCLAGWKAGWTYAPPKHGFYRVLSRNYQPGAVAEEPDRLRREEEDEKEGCIPVRRWCGGRAGGGEGIRPETCRKRPRAGRSSSRRCASRQRRKRKRGERRDDDSAARVCRAMFRMTESRYIRTFSPSDTRPSWKEDALSLSL